MSLIKPNYVENMFHSFFNLDPDRPKYYNLVFMMTRNILAQLGQKETMQELDNMIKVRIEEYFKAPMFAVLDAYYLPRFYFSKLAYCKIGDDYDARTVTRYEMTVIFEEMKDWCYDRITELIPYVRFTRTTEFMQ